jgi:hypothetical protein|tara:strand:- start:1187 stop:1972 length:786 start_codon:yes stop_codon:yes gene_type:complete
MIKYAKLECTVNEYDDLQKVQRANKNPLKEQFIGSRRKLYNSNNMIGTISSFKNLELGALSQPQFNAFLGAFNKQLFRQFAKNSNLYNIHIDFEGASREKSYDNWENLKKGEYFYNLDLKSAYWQVANKLGYLNDKMYDKYIHSDEYKMAKRLCISFLARQNYMIYYINDKEFQVNCDISVFKKVYENIRYYLYSTITGCINEKLCWLEYNIDGISITANELDYVKKYMNDNDLQYKITECRKVDNTKYLYGSKERKFRNR